MCVCMIICVAIYVETEWLISTREKDIATQCAEKEKEIAGV